MNGMNATKHLAAATLLAAALLACCASPDGNGRKLVWNGGESDPPPADNSRKKGPEGDRIVKIPEAVMDQVRGFVNRPQIFIADRIEVDASRIPFQVAMVPLADPEYVQTIELAAPRLKATGFLLRCLVDQPMVERDYARLRVGDGIDLVASREIQLRTYSEVDPKRPAFLRIRALGHAVYKDEEEGRRLERDAITLDAAVISVSEGMKFRKRVY
ncbi:MAG: hypothetical protein ACYTDY_03655 [Planctomycetota bacterium]